MTKRKQGKKELATMDTQSQRMELKVIIDGVEYMGELSGDMKTEKKRKPKEHDARIDTKKMKKEKFVETASLKQPKRNGNVNSALEINQMKLTSAKNGKPPSRRKYSGIRTRTSPKTLFLAIHSLSASQKQCVEEMGFGKILDMKVDGIPSKLGYYVVDRFDEKKMEIKLDNGSSIKITKESIHDMLGVPNGGVELHSLECTKTDDNILKEWKKQYGKTFIRSADVMREIVVSEDAGWNFKLNFLTLFSNTMAESMKMGTCNLSILSYIHEDTVIKDIDWCGYIWDCLKVSKVGWKRNVDICFYAGPLTFLALLYLDATKCKKVPVARHRPAIKSWSMEHMRQRELAEIEAGGFGLVDFHDPLESTQTKDEEDLLAIEWKSVGERSEKKEYGCCDSSSPTDNVEDYLLKMSESFSFLMSAKTDMESTLREAKTKFPNAHKLKEWETKLETLFGGKSDLNDEANDFKHKGQTTKCMEDVDADMDEGEDEQEDDNEEDCEEKCDSDLSNYNIGLTPELVGGSSVELLLSVDKSVHQDAMNVKPLNEYYEEKPDC